VAGRAGQVQGWAKWQERGKGTRAEQKGQKATPGSQQRHPYKEGLELEGVI